MQSTRHLMIDAYECSFEQANSVLFVNNMLVTLSNELEMRPVMPPFVLPYYYCEDPDDGGISAFIICENGSHITIHTFPYRFCYFVDILTDRFFPEAKAVEHIRRLLYAETLNVNLIDRRNGLSGEIDDTIDFGPHYMISVNDFDATFDGIFRWLDHIAPKINMTPISRPYVIYDHVDNPSVISGILVVAQSHIAFHYSIAERSANIDIFSCSFLDDGVVESIIDQSFGDNKEIHLFARGSKHKANIRYSEKHNVRLNNNNAWRKNSQ